MRGGVRNALRGQLLGDEPGEAFRQPHADPADAFGPEPDRRREHEVGAIGLEQVDGADVGRETPLDEVDDVRQRLSRVAALRDEPADFVERPERSVGVGIGRRRQHSRAEQEGCLNRPRESAGSLAFRPEQSVNFVPAPRRAYIVVRPAHAPRAKLLEFPPDTRWLGRWPWPVSCSEGRAERPAGFPLRQSRTP